jgi:hypothetical protein
MRKTAVQRYGSRRHLSAASSAASRQPVGSRDFSMNSFVRVVPQELGPEFDQLGTQYPLRATS